MPLETLPSKPKQLNDVGEIMVGTILQELKLLKERFTGLEAKVDDLRRELNARTVRS